MFELPNGKTSRLDLPPASLVEYTDNSLTLYYAGHRELTTDEKAIIDEWKKVSSTPEFKKRADYDMLTDGSSTYYEKKLFFSERNSEYLMGFETQRGMIWDWNKHMVRDDKIKGEVMMKYEIRKVA